MGCWPSKHHCHHHDERQQITPQPVCIEPVPIYYHHSAPSAPTMYESTCAICFQSIDTRYSHYTFLCKHVCHVPCLQNSYTCRICNRTY